MTDQRPGDRFGIFLLVVGCLSLAAAVAIAHAHPPTGYEVSIYTGTPLPFWVGVGATWLLALVVAVATPNRWLRWAATTVGGAAAVAVVGLPLIRGYHFYGSADSLSHLGWIRDLGGGRIGAVDLLYPGIHSASVMVSHGTGLGYPRAAMLAVVAVAVGFFVAVPAAVWALTGSGRAGVVGAFSAFMLLPINLVVTQPVVHPITQASLFLAMTLYLLVRYVTSADGDGRFSPTALGAALALVSVGLLLYHPQAAMAFLVVMGTAAAVQFLARRRYTRGPVTDLRPVYAQTLLLVVAFLLWTSQQEAAIETFDLAFRTVAAFASGEPVPLAGEVTQTGTSLATIGASLLEVYVKLLLVGTVFALLAALLFTESVAGRLSGVTDATEGVVRVLSLGLAALLAFAVLHFLGPLSDLVFRYVSLAMTLVTILGAVALYRFGAGLPAGGSGRSPARMASLVVVLVVMFGLAVPTVFSSPYVYQPSGHAPEQQFDGYEATFEYTGSDAEILSVRGGVARYRHAIQGTTGNTWVDQPFPPGAIDDDLSSNSTTDRYVAVTQYDYEREVVVYRELRYTREHFRTIATQPGINRVHSNGEFELYYDRGEGEEER